MNSDFLLTMAIAGVVISAILAVYVVATKQRFESKLTRVTLVLILFSVFLGLASQIDVVTKLSSGGSDDDGSAPHTK